MLINDQIRKNPSRGNLFRELAWRRRPRTDVTSLASANRRNHVIRPALIGMNRCAAFHKWLSPGARHSSNRTLTNRITSLYAARLPGFGIIKHIGRRSGRLYRTPVNVFREPDGFLIALTYGRECEWVRNVVAAEGCPLETRRVLYQLSAPTIIHDASLRRFPLSCV